VSYHRADGSVLGVDRQHLADLVNYDPYELTGEEQDLLCDLLDIAKPLLGSSRKETHRLIYNAEWDILKSRIPMVIRMRDCLIQFRQGKGE
jgi:hypothetical protein